MHDAPLRPEDRARWNDDGWCVVDGLFSAEEIAAAQSALAGLFPSADAVADQLHRGEGDRVDVSWDATKPVFPFDAMALNHLVVHERLIDLAEDLLGTDRVRLYQGLASAKYSDGAPDYEQLLHLDYGNHTLVVPRADRGYQHLELFVYLSDVTAETAATRVVSRRLTADIPVERMYLHLTEYAPLYEAEVPAEGPAGAVLAYRPDLYHRGTSLTAAGSARYLLHVAFKPVDTDWLGYQAWPVHGEGRAWNRLVGEVTPRQLTVLGFPEPGHPYWNQQTLDGVAARYPRLDMGPWRRATTTGGK